MNFQEILKIIELAKNPRVSALKNLFRGDSSGTKLYRLFKGIESGEFDKDEVAAAELYKSNPQDKRYTMLHINLAEELVQNIPFFDYSKRFSHFKSRSFEFDRTLLAINILLAAGLSSAAVWFTKRLLNNATKYDVTSIRLNCLRILRGKTLYEGSILLMEEYSKELNTVLRLYNEELKAEELCLKIEKHFISSTAQKQEIADIAFHYADYLTDVQSHITSSNLELYRYRILLYALQISGKFSEAITLCNEAQDFLQSHPLLDSDTRQSEFMVNAMECSISLRDYGKAIAYGRQCLHIYTTGSYNWYQVLNSMFICALQTEDFVLAVDLHEKAVHTSGFELLTDFEKDSWKVYHAYLSLILKMGAFQSHDKQIKKEFSISHLLDTVPQALKDKKGMNIQINILHILYYLYQKKYDRVSTQIKSFEMYALRYLQSEEHHRTLLFLKLLKLLKKKDYQIHEAAIAAKPIYEELLHSPQNPEQLTESSEIIPYDRLWKWILQTAPTKIEVKAKKRGRLPEAKS